MDAIQRKGEFQKAIKLVRETIAGDKELRKTYLANIAMAFYDAYKADGGKKYKTTALIAAIAHEAADNFLTTWCK